MIQKVEMYQAVCDGCGLIHYDNILKTSKFMNNLKLLVVPFITNGAKLTATSTAPAAWSGTKKQRVTNLKRRNNEQHLDSKGKGRLAVCL